MKIGRARTHAQPSSSHPDRPYSGKRRMKTDLSLSLLFAQELCEHVQSVTHKHSSKTLAHPNTPLLFKGSLLGSLVSLGRVEGFVCFSLCGQDVASTSH